MIDFKNFNPQSFKAEVLAFFERGSFDALINTYDVFEDPVLKTYFVPLFSKLQERIKSYGQNTNQYGEHVHAHLQRTSGQLKKFMIEELQFDEKAAENAYYANLLQDLGKTHEDYAPVIWMTEHRPTEEERALKRLHPEKGVEIYAREVLACTHKIENEDARQAFLTHPHLTTIIPGIMLLHHARLDQAGPLGAKAGDLGLVLQSICIIDAEDGDLIPRTHQEPRDEAYVLKRMAGLIEGEEKYVGAFDPDLLKRYIRFREKQLSTKVL